MFSFLSFSVLVVFFIYIYRIYFLSLSLYSRIPVSQGS